MNWLTTATLSWFDDGCCDVKYLDEWQDVPLSYVPGQKIDNSWHEDVHEVLIGMDENGRLFQRAADLLMRYQFYPSQIMNHVSDFGLNLRWAEAGDRIAQRIHIYKLGRTPVLDVISMTEITETVTKPRCRGFTYATVETHVEQGEWSVHVSWQPTGELILRMRALSRPCPAEPRRNYGFMRTFQKRAHAVGIAHFKAQVLDA